MTVIKVDTLKSLLRKLLFENYLVLFSFFRTLRLLSSYELLIVIMIFIADKAILRQFKYLVKCFLDMS
jgi:hypothetical protein